MGGEKNGRVTVDVAAMSVCDSVTVDLPRAEVRIQRSQDISKKVESN